MKLQLFGIKDSSSDLYPDIFCEINGKRFELKNTSPQWVAQQLNGLPDGIHELNGKVPDSIGKQYLMIIMSMFNKESKMTPKQEKYLTEKYIRPMVRKMLKENQFDDSKLKDAAERLSQFFRVENNRTKIYQLLKSTEFNSNGEPTSNVQELTKLLNSTSDAGTKNYIRVALTR